MSAYTVIAIYGDSESPYIKPILAYAVVHRFIDMPPLKVFRVQVNTRFDYVSIRQANRAAWAYIRNMRD